jgi:hypothetical protein
MKHFRNHRTSFAIAIMALLLALSIPATSLGNDRGRGRRDRDDQDWSRRDRKCRKFVNCHDARDGRWDRRGPRGDRVGNVVLRNRSRNRFDDNQLVFRNRRFIRNRNNNFWLNRRRFSQRNRLFR